MIKKIFPIFLLFNLLFITPLFSQNQSKKDNFCSITILYDNTVSTHGTKADWGFSCIIQGMEKIILFDTGTQSNLLLHNMKVLNVNIDTIDFLVLSHTHFDHTYAIPGLLEKNNNILIYIPKSWPKYFTETFLNKNAKVKMISGPTEIIKNVHLTSELDDQFLEQVMVLDTPQGLVIITGCAHPGIINILKKVKSMFEKKIYLVLGGFHLLENSEQQIKEIISEFKTLGVKKCIPTHCTGNMAMRLFQEAYGSDYIPGGTGLVFFISKNN
jgi:7,8-dihydropterin-6-yl-methyl-4-(beta-D-ribofuranosyl)aminobenzene 5'-phosphate synthase